MKLTLQREASTATSTPGTLSVDGVFECFTLEDVVREQRNQDGSLVPVAQWKVDKKTAIPTGIYRVIFDYSMRFKRIMPHILDVLGFSGIRIHSGNTDEDTDGCILVGRVRRGNFVLESRTAMAALIIKMRAAIKNGEGITIEILGPKAVPNVLVA